MNVLGLMVIIVFLLIWWAPIILIAKSGKTQGGEKISWILAIFFISWFAWVFYLLLAPLKQTA